ncbi:MAG: hypothetical protein WA782_01870 [Sulfitobacter sp.]
MADYNGSPVCAGAIVGPIVPQNTRGQIAIDGNNYQMPLNETGRTCLYSGPDGLHSLT